ncbi:hypothetical protein BC831DRAFT_489802 [Entophlyctis helioformis]|nr:hypothetical protein BC831DRAFT_489802 [Entophlyctis helioformis]
MGHSCLTHGETVYDGLERAGMTSQTWKSSCQPHDRCNSSSRSGRWMLISADSLLSHHSNAGRILS